MSPPSATGNAIASPVPLRPAVVARQAVLTRTRAFIALTKPRIIELLLITTVPAMLLAHGGMPAFGLLAVVLVGGTCAAGAANAINCYLDRDIDPLMNRTSRRPLVTHVVSPRQALIFGLALGVFSVTLMAAFTNPLATGLTLAAIVYYDLIYTAWLKRTTKHNTFWGGVCGAMPVLIGWSAVTGSLATPAPWLLFGVVFCWQMPHFYALALKFRDDYARAGIPMLPVVASPRHVARDAVIYSWLTVAVSLAVWLFGAAGLSVTYGIPALICGGFFIAEAHGLYSRAAAGDLAQLRPMRLFHWSTAYLTIVFVAVAVDTMI